MDSWSHKFQNWILSLCGLFLPCLQELETKSWCHQSFWQSQCSAVQTPLFFISYLIHAVILIKITTKYRRSTNERPGSDHVTWGPMKGLKKIAWGGDRYIDIKTDIATTKKNRPQGRFFENYLQSSLNSFNDTKRKSQGVLFKKL